MNKILDKIKNVPIGVKAAAVYTLASVFSKGLAIITVPIFTRIMSTSEIGVVNLYNSWNSMLNAVVTLSLTSGGYSAALKEFGKERDQYQSYVSLRFRLMMVQKNILQQTCLILLLQKICSGNFTSTDGL